MMRCRPGRSEAEPRLVQNRVDPCLRFAPARVGAMHLRKRLLVMETIEVRRLRGGEHAQCEDILRSLPDWFGIEDAILHYVEQTKALPTWIAERRQQVAGFLTLKRHSREAGEIYCMAVRAEHHRSGVGRAMVQRVEQFLAEDGALFLQVKTVGPSRPCEHYDRTRRFYEAMGFAWLEEIPNLWPGNPCLLLVKALGNAAPHHSVS